MGTPNVVYRTRADIEQDLMAVYETITGRSVTDLNEGSVLRTFLRVIAAEIQESDYQINQAALRASLRYARGDDLDLIGLDEGVSRKSTEGSGGSVRLSKASAAIADSAVAAAGTIVVSNGTTNFTNTSPCRIFAGSTSWVVDDGVYGTIDIPFTSQTDGSSTNSGAHTITQVVTAPAEVDSCDNPLAFEGGRQQETDSEYRERIKYERDNRTGASRLALVNTALRLQEVFSAEFYEWQLMPSGSKYVKPSPGEVWGYVMPDFAHSDTFEAGQQSSTPATAYALNPSNIQERVRNTLEPVRAYPISLKVWPCFVVKVDVEIDITLYRNYRLADTSAAEQDLAQRIRAHILSLKINEDLSVGHVYKLISDVMPYKDATVKFHIERNRTHSWTEEDVTTSVDAEFDECIKPAGDFSSFGTITITNEE